MSIFDRALHIPAERLFFEPQRAQHERVLLPLTARPAPRFYGALVLSAFAAFACLCMGIEMARSRVDGGGTMLFATGFLVAAILPAAVALVGLRDALRRGPFLTIDAEGVRDTRLGAALILWADVTGAELMASASGINAVRLMLREEGAPCFNPFRLGGWSVDWAQRRRSRTIALMALDVRAHALAHAMLALAARHGATIEQPSPWQVRPLG